jgi:hypothetical protein
MTREGAASFPMERKRSVMYPEVEQYLAATKEVSA